MKISKYSIIASLGAAMMALFGCAQAEIEESKAIIPQETEYVLPAAASEQVITIYADGKWTVDLNADWLSVNPTFGQGTMDITLTAEENTGDAAREAKLLIKGSATISDVEIAITQKMDRFRAEKTVSVTEALALKENALAKLSECQVVATTTNGFVVSDGTSNIFIQGSASVKAGDKLTLTGDVIAFNGITAIKLEDAFKTTAAEIKYPAATEVDFKEYKGTKSEYVSATVSYSDGGVLNVNGEQVAKVYNPTDKQNAYAYHKVTVKGYTLGVVDNVPAILVVEIIDIEMEAIPYMQFEIGTADFKTANPSFGENHKFNANVGGGYIEYIPDDLANSDPDGVWKMDISGNDPRCTGPWPGDYWYFVGATKVVANSEFRVKFGSRVSATGHKYWMLEYRDGEIWKPAADVKVSTDMPEGENVEYTHAMNADGGTNIIVDETFSITKNMDRLEMRFRCVTNWQANGKGPLAKRNTGSARLSVKSDGSKGDASVVAPQPSILITKMGAGQATVDPEPEYTNIELSTSVLAF
ncbi:MAG: BACON domain-containing protein, partial [Candidatus Cryptobacteroides sp.]